MGMGGVVCCYVFTNVKIKPTPLLHPSTLIRLLRTQNDAVSHYKKVHTLLLVHSLSRRFGPQPAVSPAAFLLMETRAITALNDDVLVALRPRWCRSFLRGWGMEGLSGYSLLLISPFFRITVQKPARESLSHSITAGVKRHAKTD